MRIQPDYQFFDFAGNGAIGSVGERLRLKMNAIPLPDLHDKEVLDIGCDFGFWSFLAASLGAKRVLGLDRNRSVKGTGFVNLVEMNRQNAQENGLPACDFAEVNIGKQWREFGRFDARILARHHGFDR